MEDGDADDNRATTLEMNPDSSSSNNKHHQHGEAPGRPRSGSAASSSHRRSMSGSLLSKLSFLRTPNPAALNERVGHDGDGDGGGGSGGGDDDGDGDGAEGDNDVPVSTGSASASPGAGLRGGSKAMASALQQQQQRRTRKRRGSLRKTALLGTRLESKKMNRAGYNINNGNSNSNGDDESGGQQQHVLKDMGMRSFVNAEDGPAAFELGGRDSGTNPRWGYAQQQQQQQQKKPLRGTRHESDMLGDETGTDDETNSVASTTATNLQRNHLGTPSSTTGSYFALSTADSTAAAIHRTKSHHHHHHLLHHHHTTEIKTANHHQEIPWDYSETESWGWIILIVTWLVFVVGMGSCFGVWSWAWDVGETPYAPPELEDDPSLPIVGYYPALIILTAVMSWVWVVVAWVGMKYFKHANISGEEI